MWSGINYNFLSLVLSLKLNDFTKNTFFVLISILLACSHLGSILLAFDKSSNQSSSELKCTSMLGKIQLSFDVKENIEIKDFKKLKINKISYQNKILFDSRIERSLASVAVKKNNSSIIWKMKTQIENETRDLTIYLDKDSDFSTISLTNQANHTVTYPIKCHE
jgi:hypothetical protein